MSELAQGFSDGHSIYGSQETSCIQRKGFLRFLSYTKQRVQEVQKVQKVQEADPSYPHNQWYNRKLHSIKHKFVFMKQLTDIKIAVEGTSKEG